MTNNYFLATDEKTIFVYSKLEQGQTVTTGQPKLFYYETEAELISVLKDYGQEYVDPNTIIINNPLKN